ncbi:ComEC/Rec2 family competence protein [Nitratiruptor tergarcus]|uniref:Competence protein ComEC n=1 Tax=Nitratiruptor tergarcus DSM 16512 TaxID=1069081 RepID=A0A1W1WS18_9BACT|nr:ComEC/Rec2 family competence protein [Nitratiruptor tergarcus]SMC09002.1 competence protein ComEC [Nitratiruptor tergarcus DSM 16512]
MLAATPLFSNVSQRLIAFFLVFLLFCFNLFWEYRQYNEIFSKKRYFTTATVKNQYAKGKKQVLKLQSLDGFTFYTTSYEQLRDLRDRKVKVLLFSSKKRVSFIEFLHNFYIPAYIIAVLPKDRFLKLKDLIVRQHSSKIAKEIFGALFLATSLDYNTRQKLSSFGISHLVAISGFHIGFLVAIVVTIFLFLFRSIWQRFLPHRNIYTFATLLALFVAGGYFLLLGNLPSVTRAFIMAIVGFILFDRHIKLLSFETLFWIVLIVLALFPRFVFSYGFWLSVSGVYMIYLFLYHVKIRSPLLLFIALNFWVFWFMLPLSLAIFGQFSPLQLLSPLLSMAFAVFYPLALLLHIIGIGGSLDWMLYFLESDVTSFRVDVPLWQTALFLLLTLLSIYRRAFIWGAALIVGLILVYQIA